MLPNGEVTLPYVKVGSASATRRLPADNILPGTTVGKTGSVVKTSTTQILEQTVACSPESHHG